MPVIIGATIVGSAIFCLIANLALLAGTNDGRALKGEGRTRTASHSSSLGSHPTDSIHAAPESDNTATPLSRQ